MIRKTTKRYALVSLLFLTTGCLPYKSDFTCSQRENGKCVSVETAYSEAKNHKGADNPSDVPRNAYRDALFDRFAGLLRDPETPVIIPSKTMRVLILPYRGNENELFMPRYAYVLIGEPSWILAKEVKTSEED